MFRHRELCSLLVNSLYIIMHVYSAVKQQGWIAPN